jgi:Fe-Mn family superoxide dismutase
MYQLPPLPYAADALAPVISAATLQTHHDKHHARYVKVTNELAGNTHTPLEELIAHASQQGNTKLFNNAAQAWNHAFYWASMSARPDHSAGALQQAIAGSFGDVATLRKQFISKGAEQFGSGWVWLMADDGKLAVVATHDAEVPWLRAGGVPLLVCDVWEHAYYLDYRNERERYLESWFDRLANWEFAATQLSGGAGRFRYPLPA